jgi:hypothetical protein
MLISDIIKQYIVDKLDNTLTILSVQAPANDLQTVTFCNIKWLRCYDFIMIGSQAYVVDSYNGNTVRFEIAEGADPIGVDDIVTINRPLFLNGTLSNTKLEWNKYGDDERAKLPFIWLVSPTDVVTASPQNGRTKTAPVKLWFVHWSNWQKLNADRQDEAIRPLMALVDEFVDTIERQSHVFEDYDNFTARDFPKLGVETPNGVGKTLFDSTLSGIEFDSSLKIFHRYCEKC